MNTLYVGFGDLAQRVRCCLAPSSGDVAIRRSAIRRSTSVEDITLWQGDVRSAAVIERVATTAFARVLVTLTPTIGTEAAYREAYLEPLRALLCAWRLQPPARVVWVSSSGVYAQTDGSWVDETSPCTHEQGSGKVLHEAEVMLLNSGLNGIVARLAGIYGPGRDFLQRQVLAGKGGDESFTNRIHVDDAARFLAHLLSEPQQGPWAERLYNVCDNEPAPAHAVRQWLAERLGVAELAPSPSGRGGNKRVANTRLKATGFRLRYPTYREGYGALLGG